MEFSLIFHVFSRTPSGNCFWRVQAPIYARKCSLGAILEFRGFPKWTLFNRFNLNKSSKTMRQIYQDQPGAQAPPATATSGPKQSKTMFSFIFHWFWMDWGPILDGFSMFWEDFLMICIIVLHTFWRRFPIAWWEYAKRKELLLKSNYSHDFSDIARIIVNVSIPAWVATILPSVWPAM